MEEWVARLCHERRVAAHIGPADDPGKDPTRGILAITGGEATADDAFLDPLLARPKLSPCRQAGQLRAGAGAAGGAVVLAPGAIDEVTAVGLGQGRRPEELDVVDLGPVGPSHLPIP